MAVPLIHLVLAVRFTIKLLLFHAVSELGLCKEEFYFCLMIEEDSSSVRRTTTVSTCSHEIISQFVIVIYVKCIVCYCTFLYIITCVSFCIFLHIFVYSIVYYCSFSCFYFR